MIEVSREEFVKRIYAKILAKNVFLEKLPFNMNTLLKTNETAEWIAHMVLEDVVLLDAGKWEALQALIKGERCRGCWGFGNDKCLESCQARNILRELERLVNEGEEEEEK